MKILIVLLVFTSSWLIGGKARQSSTDIKEFESTLARNITNKFLENNEIGRSLHGQLQKILSEKEIEFLPLSTKESGRKNNDPAFQSSSSLLRSNLEGQWKKISSNSTASNSEIKRRTRKIIRKVISATFRFLSRFFRSATVPTAFPTNGQNGSGSKPSEPPCLHNEGDNGSSDADNAGSNSESSGADNEDVDDSSDTGNESDGVSDTGSEVDDESSGSENESEGDSTEADTESNEESSSTDNEVNTEPSSETSEQNGSTTPSDYYERLS